MKTTICVALLFLTGLASGLCAQDSTQDSTQRLAFTSRDLDGNQIAVEPTDQSEFFVVCFLGTECPLAKLYASRLTELSLEFAEVENSTVEFFGVCSNHQDTLQDLKSYQQKHSVGFPLIKDQNNQIADAYDAQRTPEVFVLDRELNIIYRGRIDDQYQPGAAKAEPSRFDLKIALSECTQGKPVTVDRTAAAGCLIGRVKKEAESGTVTFANQVSRILDNHCSECHRPGEIGPMEFQNYDEVAGWAEMIVEVIDQERMPPWHADPAHGEFSNERRMTESEKQMLRDWLAAGTPLGDEAEFPDPRDFTESTGWRLPREPDVVVEMRDRPFTVPDEGTVDYQYFVVDPGFKEDKWVVAAEILPGERSVLHHSIVFVRPPDGESMQGIGWLAAYVPGQSAPSYNPKLGRRIPAGSRLVFQQHYTPNGESVDDMTRIGLVFGDEQEIENEVFTLVALDQEFVIPPGADDHQVEASFNFIPTQGQLMGISPHMHYRGKSFQLTAKANGQQEVLLNVPKYDFNWQHIYQLKNPKSLNKIESMRFVAAFDNSDNNPHNPDPTQQVTWGDQTWEEMAVAFVIVSVPRINNNEVLPLTPEQIAAEELREQKLLAKAERFTDEYFDRFDKNQDGKITVNELPRSVQAFGSWEIDGNYDGTITREEVLDVAKWRFMHR